MSPVTTTPSVGAPKTDAEKQNRKKKKEFRELKAKIKMMREASKASATERKGLETHLAALAAELGLPAPGSKKKTATAGV